MNAPFKIIPADAAPALPPRGGIAGRAPMYPFAGMEVGDYFECPDDMGKGHNNQSKRQNTISSAVRTWAKRYNRAAKFATRLVTKPDGTRVVGCWRTA